MKRRVQRKSKWTKVLAVVSEGPLRLNGAGVELVESVFSSDDTGTCTPALAHTSALDTNLTRNTRAPHFTPQHWLLCHMGLY